MKLTFLALVVSIFAFSSQAFAKVTVVATGTDIGAIISEVGGPDVTVDVLAKGSQDLHTIEPKPSFMSRLQRADLIVANGLALEVGWLPSVVRGARNPKINPGTNGYLDLGERLDPIEVAAGSVSRADGDVHPEGNPHWALDPIRVGRAGLLVAERLALLDPPHAAAYNDRAKKFQAQLEAKTKEWAERLKKSGVEKVITYHKTLNYFLDRFGIKGVGYLEPKPGIPPTAQHILELIKIVKEQSVKLILVEHFYDVKSADRIATEAPGVKVRTVSAAVDGLPGINNNIDLVEALVRAFEAK